MFFMAKNFKKTIAFIFFLLAGITLGAFISHICAGQPYVDWLSWGQEIGLSTSSPAMLDLIVLKLAFGFTLKVTIAQIFTVALSIFAFAKTCKSL
jgi:hypothetical protein